MVSSASCLLPKLFALVYNHLGSLPTPTPAHLLACSALRRLWDSPMGVTGPGGFLSSGAHPVPQRSPCWNSPCLHHLPLQSPWACRRKGEPLIRLTFPSNTLLKTWRGPGERLSQPKRQLCKPLRITHRSQIGNHCCTWKTGFAPSLATFWKGWYF